MKYRDENGDFQDLYFKTGDTLPIGTIVSYGSLTPPTNWLVCDGSAVSRTTYADLFAVIGTSYGSGDGSTTFNLPDLRGRVPVGKSTDTEFDTLGETGGEKTHTLTTAEMPSHRHGFGLIGQGSGPYGYNITGLPIGTAQSEYTSNTGGGQAHNILQPYQVVCFIIKAEDSAGVVGNVTNTQSDSTKDTYSCDYINDAVKHDYSTTEKVVGTWVDGKPLYEKVIQDTTTGGGATTKLIDSNLKRGWIVDGYIVATNGGNCIPLNYYSSNTIFVKSQVLSDGTLSVATSGTSTYINGDFTATVRYTKTTD